MTGPSGRGDDLEAPRRDGPPGVPHWVKAIGIAVLLAFVILIVVMALAGGKHGSGLHTGMGADLSSSISQHADQ